MLTANMKMIAECADKLAHLGEKLFNMTEMKYRAGNKVRIKSLDWYNENKDMNGLVGLFTPSMKKLCGMVVTLDSAYNGKYTAIEEEAKGYYLDDSMIEGLADEMIEGLVENDNPFDDDMIPLPDSFVERMAEKIATSELFNVEPLDIPTMTTDFVKENGLPCPNGYIFKDENGNVINATMIVLEKKKKEYPKTLEECCNVLSLGEDGRLYTKGYKASLIQNFQKLLIARDAYWKIAGEEMGLGKPWEPDWSDEHQKKFTIYTMENAVIRHFGCYIHCILAFPTEEMRDAFYENFKSDIEICKELL